MRDIILSSLLILFFASLFVATAHSQEPNSTSEPNVLAKFEIDLKDLGLITLLGKVGDEEFLFILDTGTTALVKRQWDHHGNALLAPTLT